jgi:hypothetical protein
VAESHCSQATSAWDIVCTTAAGIDPIINETKCKKMAGSIQRCDTLLEACGAYPVSEICDLAADYCYKALGKPFLETGRNPYDRTSLLNTYDSLGEMHRLG